MVTGTRDTSLPDAHRRIDTDALRERWPLEDLAARYGVRLRGSGRRLYGRCPFHDDHTPSLVVYPSSRSWFCFGCRQWGDAIDWVARLEGLDFARACELLGAGRLDPRPSRPPRPRPSPFADGLPGWALEALEAAAEIYHAALGRSMQARWYARARGIRAHAIARARLGFSSGCDLARGFHARGIPLGAARELGLLDRSGRELLGGRLVVPVVVGRQVVTMTGRAIDPRQEPRYLDLPLPTHLLGCDEAAGAGRPVLVEGVTDYLVALGWGYPACSPMGTHAAQNTRAQALALARQAELVVLAFDNDEGGRRAADDWSSLLGRKAAPVRWPPAVGDTGDLGRWPEGRLLFDRLLADAEARWRATRPPLDPAPAGAEPAAATFRISRSGQRAAEAIIR